MEQRLSHCNWGVTMLLCLFFGGLGAHRFYAGRIGSGFLYLFTLGFMGFGSLVDLIMICTGDFTDGSGALILSDAKKEEFLREHPAAGQAPDRTYGQAPAQAQGSGVIHLNHVSVGDAATISGIREHVAIGIIENGEKIAEIAAIKVLDGHIESTYRASAFDLSAEALVRFLGAKATLVGHNILAKFPAFAAALRDVDFSAEWDYIDLSEVVEATGEPFSGGAGAYGEAISASSYFNRVRNLLVRKLNV